VIDDRGDRLNLRQRMALAAEVIDDARLGRPEVAGGGGSAGFQADDPGRQRRVRELGARWVQDADRAKPEQGARRDLDFDRGDGAVAKPFGRARCRPNRS